MTARLVHGDALEHYGAWPSPTVIVSDGAYGVSGFPGDPPNATGLAAWYEPHVAAWSARARPSTTLWFWNTELGWATVHPVLERHGFRYRSCHVWDKGLAHVAGNANSRTLRKYPVVTEVCAQYVRRVTLPSNDGRELELKVWLRQEWERSGLPLVLANEACGVKNAATRKYFTLCHLWYFPPPDAFDKIVRFANERGAPAGRPYFSVDGATPLDGEAWSKLRAKFTCDVGVTNVWREPPVRGPERLKSKGKDLRRTQPMHHNQKPLKLVERIVRASSEEGDVVWEPFGGLCSVAVAATRAGRACFSAEIDPDYYQMAKRRLAEEGEPPLVRASADQLPGENMIG